MTITTGLKSIKNPVEIEGLKRVMVKDGVAWVKTFHWLEKQLIAGKIESEWSVANKIAGFRAQQPDYQGESFHPISSYGHHGAVVHYSVTPEESLDLKREGIYLLDSGGHYSDGTTDTTRTIALSVADIQQKSDFTRALKGTLGVSMLRFLKGTRGFQMDILARKALWDAGLNYGHGTGHGVGFFLSVHEGPQTIGTSA
jgi:Xaa-Pro aminopeptidase